MQHLLNVANGNSLLRWTPWQLPGRGLSTVVDITYNSFEKKCECPLGNNFSLAISTLARLGLPLDIHPNNADTIAGRSNKYVVFTDGDGTPHRFVGKNALDGTTYWEEPAGVHLYLRSITTDPLGSALLGGHEARTVSRGTSTRRGTRRASRTETETPSRTRSQPCSPGDDPGGVKKRITKVTDAGRRLRRDRLLHQGRGQEAADPRQGPEPHGPRRPSAAVRLLRGRQPAQDHPGGRCQGQRRLVPGAPVSSSSRTRPPTAPCRRFRPPPCASTPTPRRHNQSTRIYSVRDPRGVETLFTYYGPTSGQLRWRLQSRTEPCRARRPTTRTT